MLIERHLGSVAEDYESTLSRLRRVASGDEQPILRFSKPGPIVGFGRRDELNPGFDAAREACEAHGFVPWVRKVGGRAAAYHSDCMIVDHLVRTQDPTSTTMARYRSFGRLWARILDGLGMPADVGELPGEYCAGEYSVHGIAPGGEKVKVVGTAQRVVSGAWWFSAGVVVSRPEPLRAVLDEVYKALRIPMNPRTVGSVSMAVPEVRWDDVEDAVLEAYEEWDKRCVDGMS
ncbi:lipoate--protein ligase family protein [Rothia sp. HC945]|uniref:lipoyl protein ligase domain-containing protein n=1 Tax=Rothia sp. HC945 TaxID=3171170 RepID=UPI0026520407|nr:lipoate--protein ligase family protein [Kocuria sp.]MDN5617681.1 lipoate--protein ligase family protein [Kocuria sp.]